MKANTLIIGAGELGSALQNLLKTNENASINVWDKDPITKLNTESLSDLAKNADFVFLAVPSWEVRNVLRDIKKDLKSSAITVLLSKGLEAGTGKTIDKVFKEELKDKPEMKMALISGPMLVTELDMKLPTRAIVASEDLETYNQVAQLFKNSNLYLTYVSNVYAIALCGVLKNIYATALGMANGLHLGNNFKGFIVSRAAIEMESILNTLDASALYASSEAGIGDLIATGFSNFSRNFQYGMSFTKEGSNEIKGEAARSFEALISLIHDKGNLDELPLLEALSRVVLEKKNPKETFLALIA